MSLSRWAAGWQRGGTKRPCSLPWPPRRGIPDPSTLPRSALFCGKHQNCSWCKRILLSSSFHCASVFQSNAVTGRKKKNNKIKMHHLISSNAAQQSCGVKSQRCSPNRVSARLVASPPAIAVTALCPSPSLAPPLSNVCRPHPWLLKEPISWGFLSCSFNLLPAASETHACIRLLLLSLVASLLRYNIYIFYT